MSIIQKFLTAIFSVGWAKSMEADSRRWMVRCPCGFERSVWDMGGIRWKAAGSPRWFRKCPSCGHRHWHTVYHLPSDNESASGTP